MEFTAEHKKKLEWQIVDIITQSVEKAKIKEEEMAPISTFVLENIDTIKTQDELMVFLANLSEKWPIFADIQKIEQGEVKEQVEQQAIGQVQQLIHSGNIEEALAAAKAATNIP